MFDMLLPGKVNQWNFSGRMHRVKRKTRVAEVLKENTARTHDFCLFWISRHLKRLIIVFFLRLWVQGLRTPEKRAYFWTRVKNQIPILRDGGDGGGGGGEVSNQGKVLLKFLRHGWRYSMTMINFVSYRELRIYFFN